jgi:hypothetical protein
MNFRVTEFRVNLSILAWTKLASHYRLMEFRVNRSVFAWQNFAALGKIRPRENAMQNSWVKVDRSFIVSFSFHY